jgi:sarcosine oxidase subunit alpha
VKIAAYRKGQGRVITEKKVDCDFIAMSGGWNPALHLWCHNGGKISFDDGLASFRPNTHTMPSRQSVPPTAPCPLPKRLPKRFPPVKLRQSQSTAKAKAAKTKLPAVEEPSRGALEPIWFAPATGGTMKATSTSSTTRTT